MAKENFLYKKVYSDLKGKIISRQFPPNAKLPKEKELCETYQVSMITVKKALELLAEEKRIVRVPGKGTFVAEEPTGQGKTEECSEEDKNRQQAKGRTGLIGVILEYAMPSFGIDLMFELDRAAREAGYRICVRFSYSDRERESQEIEFLMSLGVEGLIILPCHGSYYNTALLKLVIDKFPVVVLDKKLEGIQVSSIRTDNRDAIYRLIDYLGDQGKRRIGIITVDERGTISLKERRRAFRERVNQLRFPVLEECILPDTAYRILKREPIEEYVVLIMEYLRRWGKQLDGVICTEYGNLLAFAEAAFRMRQEEAISGITACTIDQVYLIPGRMKYAHIKQNEAAMAEKTIEILKQQIESGEVIAEDIKIPGIFRKP